MTSETGMEAAQAPHVPYVPYEIFLLIMDAAIEGAYSEASAYRCELDLFVLEEVKPSLRMVVRPRENDKAFRSRFFLIQNISQTRRCTRDAVHRRFIRFP
ncbi:hypothetical protein CMUS01_15601 [Colletotrichum musicola]|uniref:Uncharacterized protein n=1 Tax=Colletotrichum musicola TaxID=2175873 RepID=A0A8H6MMF6_9PEZI|nr:hypothetical protein CMUS01_15601 [Colletotrichum musicola]